MNLYRKPLTVFHIHFQRFEALSRDAFLAISQITILKDILTIPAQYFAADFHCIPFPAKSFAKKVLDTIPLFESPFRFTR